MKNFWNLYLTNSPLLGFFIGLALLTFGLVDLYDDFLKVSHSHYFIFIGFILFIGALHHVHEGIHKMLAISKNEKVFNFLKSCNERMEKKMIKFSLALSLLLAALYGLITNLDEIYFRSVPLGFGLILLVPPSFGVYKNVKTLKKIRA